MKRMWFFAAVIIGGLSSFCLAYSGGDGSSGNPYQIGDVNDLLELAITTADYGKCFILTADIDMGGQVFDAAIIAPDNIPGDMLFGGISFTGNFDGNGYKITHFTIDSGSNEYLGLFGQIVNGSIANLGVENCSVSGTSSFYYVGSLTAYSFSGVITHCWSKGTVFGYRYVGGLVGFNNRGSISNSCFIGQATGASTSRFVGGIAGTNFIDNSSVNNCYAMGTVSGYLGVGGLVGANEGIINRSYSTAAVSGPGGKGGLTVGGIDGSVNDSFWDIETSGCTTSGGGTGLSTEDMQTLLTFTSAGWDFTNETVNGTSDIWRMCADGVDYPRLNWESIDGDLQCPDGVSVEDLDYFVEQWLLNNCDATNNYCGGVDGDMSNVVDLADYVILAQHWLEGV